MRVFVRLVTARQDFPMEGNYSLRQPSIHTPERANHEFYRTNPNGPVHGSDPAEPPLGAGGAEGAANVWRVALGQTTLGEVLRLASG